MSNKKNEYIVYARWMYIELVRAGFDAIEIRKNPKFPELDCYVFEDGADFRNTLTKLSKGGSRNV